MSEKATPNPKELLKSKSLNRKRLIIAGSILAVILVCAIYVGYAAGYDKIYPNTYINGVNMGGLTYGEAKEQIHSSINHNAIPKSLVISL